MRQSDFQLYAMSEIACLVVDLCWAAATYLWLLLVSKQPKQLQRYVCVCVCVCERDFCMLQLFTPCSYSEPYV